MPQLIKFTKEDALNYHKKNFPFAGKIEVISKTPLRDALDLSLAYTPGVAEPCREIKANPDMVYEYTSKGNMVAVVTDGTRILGLGDIGPMAGLPVMEGKCVLFKCLAGVDAFPICLGTKDTEEFIKTTKYLEPSFSGINLEDISAPKCFEIEQRLKKEMQIPVFHDDQHGTAISVLAGLINSLKIVGKKIGEVKVVMHGCGASGIAISKFLLSAGVKGKNLYVVDRAGILYEGRKEDMHKFKEELARKSNPERKQGNIQFAVKSADVLIGASGPNLFTKELIKSMQKSAIVFAIANPIPEILPDEAKEGGAKIIATGRSDYPNQINNVLGFPAIFRGALDIRAKDINEEMKLASAYAIASCIDEKELNEEHIITTPLNREVYGIEAMAVAKAGMDSGVARIKVNPKDVYERTLQFTRIYNEWYDGITEKRMKMKIL